MEALSVIRKIKSLGSSFILKKSLHGKRLRVHGSSHFSTTSGHDTCLHQSVASLRMFQELATLQKRTSKGWPSSPRLVPACQHPAPAKAETVEPMASLKCIGTAAPSQETHVQAYLCGGRHVKMETQHKLMASQASSPSLCNTKDGATGHHR